MKKLLVVLLSLGLILAFGMTASAQTSVKFGGAWYLLGMYEQNRAIVADDNPNQRSQALFWTRTRIQPVFQIAEGLTFTTRMDALEKGWGDTNSRGGFDDKTNSRNQQQAVGTGARMQESIEFERAYVGFKTAVGLVEAGYMSSGKWGTDFGDDEQTRPRIKFTAPMGPMTLLVVYEKLFDTDRTQQPNLNKEVDKDNDSYFLAGIYKFKGGDAGVLFRYNMFNAASSPLTGNYKTKTYAVAPYVKATFGPVYVEGEFIYMGGKAREYRVETATNKNIDLQGYGAYVKARATFGAAYAGAQLLYSSGDDGSDATKAKTGPASNDLDFGLMLGYDAATTWAGSQNGSYATFDSGKANSLMLAAFGGFNVTPKMNIEAMFVYGQVNEVPVANIHQEKDLGYEFNVKASYKIYDNLTYLIGAGYLVAGDYFKGNSTTRQIDNDYLLMNRLSLSF
jgi:hypothetical protein